MPSFLPAAHDLWPYLGAWLVMLLVSVANGALREFTYGRHMSELAAHQLSTATSIVLLAGVIRACVRLYPPASGSQAWGLGLMWLLLTMAFEFLFFHYLGGHPWSELLANYNVRQGRLWVLVLIWIACAPYLFLLLQRSP